MDARALVVSLSMTAALSVVCDTHIPLSGEGDSYRAPINQVASPDEGLRARSSPLRPPDVLKDLQASEW